ncbi:putative aminoadipate-semialdehyde dehydrogenase [Hypoxylon rubiginosum]|uniref:Aminoadipate-semialdehyde dehydrogenase n=1 Tax=Hypoxylon rubiginosum TaxID=110542 RepID=A0ACB9Z625_9PEZI|nr:putative aminoadipate-semialdehyde dehydrogenase [Hypoxylon rubiginosum]
MSLSELDESTIADLARACNISTGSIADVYSSTPVQLDMIAETRNEAIHFVLTPEPTADIDRFCEAIRQLVSLNPILRTRLARCSLGVVQVLTNEEHITERLSGDLQKFLDDDKTRYMGLGTPLFRTAFINKVFVAKIHHAVADYASMTALFGQDLPVAYLGLPLKARPPFKDFVAYCAGIDGTAARSFWASRFKGSPAIFPRLKLGRIPSFKNGTARNVILKRIGNGVSPAHVPYFIEAAWALTAAAYAASDSIAYGYVLSGRSPDLNGLETTVGPTIVEVPIQVNLQRAMTVEWLLKDRATALRQLQTNPAIQYGISEIGAISEAAKTASGFQTLLNIVPVSPLNRENDGRVLLGGSWPLVQICRIQDNRISIEPRYDSAAVCDRQLHRIVNQFEHMIQLLMDVPPHTRLNELPLLNVHDSMELAQWGEMIPRPAEECLHELFRAQVRAQPEAMAVEAGDENVSYQKLDQMSDYLACELQKRAVSPRDSGALIFENSLWFIVAILGVMKAGGVCVPIDKNEQHDRKVTILSKTNAKIILTSSAEHARSVGLAPDVLAIDAEFFAGWPDMSGPLGNETSSPEDLAYITFTSGAAGAPKGILLEHRSLVSSLRSHAQRLDWGPGSRILQFAAHTSGISVCEIFGALLFGGCLCIPPEDTRVSSLSNFIESTGVNLAMLPPGVLRNIIPDQVPSLRSLISIGEPVHAGASKDWGAALRFFNCWGACEASMLSTVAELVPSSLYPKSIGKPVGCAVWIVNPRNIHELVPIGGVGELLIQGPGVARGCLMDEARTADCFISPPQWASSFESKGPRFCRTGDLGKFNPDGSISFVGRQVNQVKLTGQTVQLEEIESVLASCNQVRDVVTSAKVSAGRTQLVAMVRLGDPHAPTVLPQKLLGASINFVEQRLDSVRTHASSRLPSNMIPNLWLDVEQIPRTASHKLDRASTRKLLKTVHK